MLPRRLLDSVVTPDGLELALYQRGDAFLIQVDGCELMSSRAHGSEDALARLTLEPLAALPAPRVLVGGLGMGFTLAAALRTVLAEHPAARLTVAEVFPAVVAWNRGPLAHLAGRPLEDPRVRVVEGDIADQLPAGPAAGGSAFDAILLDVDNGPEAFSLEANRRLYTNYGISRLFAALSPGGVLGVWSAFGDPPFEERLRRGGFAVAVHRVYARACGKGGRHTIFIARRP